MNKALRWFVVAAALIAGCGLGLVAWSHLTKPAILKVAVGPIGFVDAELMAAFGRTLNASKSNVRLTLEHTEGPTEALRQLNTGQAQLAVTRADGTASERVRAVAILHTDPVVIVAPEKAKVDDFGDLRGKTIGLIGPARADDMLLAILRNHYSVVGGTMALPMSPPAIVAAIRDRSVDALLFVVPTSRASKVSQTWSAIVSASRRKLAFVPIEDAAAIAAVSPAYEAGEVPAGLFGGAPMLPAESVTTLQVATYLVADRHVSNDVITELARSLFEDRQKMSADAPIATLIKAASTDKDAIFPVHPGAKVYFDGEETSLMERYGDWLFYGPMLLGALGSGLIGLRRFLQPDAAEPFLLPRFGAVLSAIKGARSLGELEQVRADIDTVVEGIVTTPSRGAFDQERATVTSIALSYANQVMAERRQLLLAARAGNTPDIERSRSAAE
ncbi:MAG TPA: TAXI family TRAP transporter solute-binding subunit [Candidatus Dormibacteraeota bacterium]